jgi:hypothetical protein
MSETSCAAHQALFSAYLDSALTGLEMHALRGHLEACAECAREFAQWRAAQASLSKLGPARAPADLALRLRVALSQERERTPRQVWGRLQVRWDNTVAPFLLRASAGLASALLLLGTVSVLIGTFAAPEPVAARDEPIGMASNPRLLFSRVPDGQLGVEPPGSTINGSVVVRVYVDREGRAYDFRILSGPADTHTRSSLENKLLFSTFEPARVFGQPINGTVVIAFSGVSVQG